MHLLGRKYENTGQQVNLEKGQFKNGQRTGWMKYEDLRKCDKRLNKMNTLIDSLDAKLPQNLTVRSLFLKKTFVAITPTGLRRSTEMSSVSD